MYGNFLSILFLIFIFVIKIVVVICKPSDIEEIEGDCMFVAKLENSDENLLNKVVHKGDEAYALYNDYALRMGFSIRKGTPSYYNGMKNIKQYKFLCSKEGFKLDKDFCKEKYSKRLELIIKHLFVSQLKMVFGGLVHLIQSIIINLHCNQRGIC